MRDPARIDRILCMISDLWESNPDLRFGQLVNVVVSGQNAPLFAVEDDVFEKLMNDMAKDVTCVCGHVRSDHDRVGICLNDEKCNCSGYRND